MTLTTHAAVGSLVGAIASQNLVLAATVAFMSHFVLDAIPHWDYKLASAVEDKTNRMNSTIVSKGWPFVKDLIKIGIDFTLGLVLAWLMFNGAPEALVTGAFVGALFGMLPDFLQFVYMKLRVQPFIALQRFHMYIHATGHYKDQPLIGIPMQILFIGICFVLSGYIFNF